MIFDLFKANIIWKQDLQDRKLVAQFGTHTWGAFCYSRLTGQRPIGQAKENNCARSSGLDFPMRTPNMDHIGKFSVGPCSLLRTQFFPTRTSWPANNIYFLITCRPPPTITWKKNGQTIVTGDDFEIAGTFLGRRLDLINVKKDIHEDTYTCEAENSQNSGNPNVFTTIVTVKGM